MVSFYLESNIPLVFVVMENSGVRRLLGKNRCTNWLKHLWKLKKEKRELIFYSTHGFPSRVCLKMNIHNIWTINNMNEE